MSGYLARNVEALAAHQRVPVDRLAVAPHDVRVDAANGVATLLLHRGDSWLALNSRRDPLREARRWLDDTLNGSDPSTVVVIGAGLGYVLDALDERRPETRVLAIEPTPECARALLDHRDWAERVTSGRLRVLVGPDFAGTEDVLWMLEGTPPPVVTHPTLAHELPHEVAAAQRAAARAVYAACANRDARLANAGRYLTNTLRNAATIASEADVSRLDGLFDRHPAVVISAGPSLDQSLDDLRRLQDQALLIAVDTALRPLLMAGVVPHLVVALDPTRGNAEHMLDLPDPSGVYLVAEGSVNPAAFAPFRGRTFVFRVAEHHPWPWLASLGCDRGRLQVWGSVATAAFDIARRVGADPIIFCGQDLAYTDGRSYCRRTTWERTATPPGTRTEIADVDISGQKTTTAKHLVSFRDWLVEQSTRDSRRYINASGRGILRGGRIEAMALAEALPARVHIGPTRLRERLLAAHVTSDSTSGMTLAARRLSASISDNPSLPEPVPSWLAFAGPTMSAEAIVRALDGPPRTESVIVLPPRADSRPALSPADQARLASLTAGDAAERVRVLYIEPTADPCEPELAERLDKATADLLPGHTLIVADLTDRVTGSAVRQAVQACLTRRSGLACGRLYNVDWLSRLTLIVREPAGRAGFAHTRIDTALLAEVVVRQLAPSSVTAVGPGASTWMEPFSQYPQVSTTPGLTRYDVVLAMDALVQAPAGDHQRLIDEMAALGDTIVLAVPTPGFEREPQINFRPITCWAEMLLSRGFVLSDELRPWIEDRPDFPGRAYTFSLLHVARRIQSPTARAALSEHAELRALLVASASRIDSLFVQAAALRRDRHCVGVVPEDHSLEIAIAADEIEPVSGHCFSFRFVGAGLRAAQRAGLLRRATVEEDGTVLPFAHAMADDIQVHGGGRYWVRADAVYLSASDNSDPRINGRRYTLRVSTDAALAAGWVSRGDDRNTGL